MIRVSLEVEDVDGATGSAVFHLDDRDLERQPIALALRYLVPALEAAIKAMEAA